jgi:hypothetical protein
MSVVWPMELRKLATVVHGGTTARVIAGEAILGTT